MDAASTFRSAGTEAAFQLERDRSVALELRNVSKQVGGDVHIHPTDLTLAEEGFNILLGTTLAGKTTLMQLMAGLDRPSAGSVWFNGRDVTGVAVQKRNVSMVYQQFINYPNMTVFENIASPLRVARMDKAEIASRIARLAELLRLTPLLQRRPAELSGGQQQRTALARALAKDADLVLLDEPLANLDFKLREELRDELPKLFADRPCTVVYATTEPVEALLLGGHTVALHEGRVTQFGPTAETYRNPADVVTAQVFSDPPINVIAADKRDGRIVLSDSVSWPAPKLLAGVPDGPVTVGLRPHHVTPEPRDGEAVGIEGTVQITELSGSESIIHFRHGEHGWVSQSHGLHAMKVGATAEFHANVARCLYFGADGRRIGG